MTTAQMQRSADISVDGMHRYSLTRIWDENLPLVAFCGLNPSTADAEVDDNTIRKEIGFAKLWGFGGFQKVNLSSLRSTDPSNLRPVHFTGDNNLKAILNVTRDLQVVACWGASFPKLAAPMVTFLKKTLLATRTVYHLGLTKDGHPRHPLYLPYEGTVMTPWEPEGGPPYRPAAVGVVPEVTE